MEIHVVRAQQVIGMVGYTHDCWMSVSSRVVLGPSPGGLTLPIRVRWREAWRTENAAPSPTSTSSNTEAGTVMLTINCKQHTSTVIVN